jgi:hypothetical protein
MLSINAEQSCFKRLHSTRRLVLGINTEHWCSLIFLIENLSNLWYPLITGAIGFGFSQREDNVKIEQLHAAGGSLAEVVSSKSAWLTPTAKAAAIVGIVLSLQFSHRLELVHGGLNSGTILFAGRG